MVINGVIFDLYGTLVDIETDESDPHVYEVLSQFLTYYEISLKPQELAARYREISALHMRQHPGPFGEIDVFQVFEEILEKVILNAEQKRREEQEQKKKDDGVPAKKPNEAFLPGGMNRFAETERRNVWMR